MDEMKFKLGSKFLKEFIANIVTTMIYKKLGYDINVALNEIDVEMIDGKVRIHANIDAELDKSEFYKIVKSVKLK